ncbi:hypothetical protein QR98_0044700 [Sarcoptes scabiei]|uniref:Uncharacterized protein n=1 Tax=Sarcoptes scabiei TaxID=52283 RepID=A0A132A4Y1_SARSC|nr:hypothetical protein QR98_0044700 [Sarcoptes scabiei]
MNFRDSIDKLISRWNIENQTANSDVFVFDLQFSWLLPIKKFTLRRNWGDAIQDGISLNEIGNSIRSHWIMVPNGKGQTLVKHDIYLELSKWYQTVYSAVHDNQLKLLAKSFELNHGIMNASTI